MTIIAQQGNQQQKVEVIEGSGCDDWHLPILGRLRRYPRRLVWQGVKGLHNLELRFFGVVA